MNFTKAKRSLGLDLCQSLIGREAEFKAIADFLIINIQASKSGCLCISGLPGTGKTACVKNVLKQIKIEYDVSLIFLNCMELSSASDLYKRIYNKLVERPIYQPLRVKNCGTLPKTPIGRRRSGAGSLNNTPVRVLRGGTPKSLIATRSPGSPTKSPIRPIAIQASPRTPSKISSKFAAQRVEDMIVSSETITVLVLDEIDQLLTNNMEVLYTVFNWVSMPQSKVIVVGIANAFDLTERILPKLEHQTQALPKRLNFAPYTKDQVVEILKFRLADVNDVLSPEAIEICARKVSAITGDIRKALEICKLAIDKLDMTETKCRSIEPAEILSTVNRVYGDRNCSDQATVLPLQQKLVLAVIIRFAEQKSHAFSVNELYSAYKATCARLKLPPVEQSEVEYICQMLECLRFITKSTPKKSMTKKSTCQRYQLSIDATTAKRSLNDESLLAQVLQ